MADQTTNLKLFAQALGFQEGAANVEVLAAAEKHLLEISKQLEQARLTGTIEDVQHLTEEADILRRHMEVMKPAQEGVNASERDWIGVLRQVNPALGNFVDNGLKAAKVMQEMAAGKRLLGTLAAALTPIFTAVAGTLVVMAKEYAEVTQQIREQAKALDELKRKERDRQQGIEDARAGTRLPAFDEDQSRAARETADRIGAMYPFIDPEAVNKAVAFAGGAAGGLGGGAFGAEDIARLGRLIQMGPQSLTLGAEMNPAAVQREITSELARHRERLDAEFAREAGQAAEQAARAPIEARQVGGSTLNLRERIARRAQPGMDIDHLIAMAQKFGTREEVDQFAAYLDDAITGVRPISHVLRRAGQGLGLLGVDVGQLDPRFTAKPEELTVLAGVFQEMMAESRRATDATERLEQVIRDKNFGDDNRWARFVVPTAREQGRARSNGDSRARAAER